MRKLWLWSLALVGLALSPFLVWRSLNQSVPLSPYPSAVTSAPTPSASPEPSLQFKVYSLPQSIVYTLLIPAHQRFLVTPALASQVETVEDFAKQQGAIAVLNGGFFDPENQKSTSYVVLNRQLVADPRWNQRMMGNPDLQPYLPQILNRTELRWYQCEQTIRYEIVIHSQAVPAGCQMLHALGGGPRLLPKLTAVAEGFLAYRNGEVIRDPLGSERPNSRTAVGLTQDGQLLWVMVAQKPGSPDATGMSLPELANFLKSLGVKQAINLDGGGSSSLYHQGKAFYGQLDQADHPIKRPVKSFLMLRSR